MEHRHLSGSMKQQNKSHKTRHRTKSELSTASKGRIDAFKGAGKNKALLNRDERRLQNGQLRKNKRESTAATKRAIGAASSPPMMVLVVALQGNGSNAIAMANVLAQAADKSAAVTELSTPTTVYCHRLKQRITFIAAPRDITAVLHFARLCDTLLCVSEQQLPPDASGVQTLASLCAQGVPTTAYAIVALDQLSTKKRSEAKRMAAKQALDKFPDAKVHFFEKPSDANTTLWAIGNQKRRRVIWRELRAHVYAQELAYDPVAQELAVSGYVRGRPLNVNGLVHLPGLGARPVGRVLSALDPSPMPSKARHADATMDIAAGEVVATPNEEWQHSLQTEVEVSPFEGEQTYPTIEEEQAAQQDQATQIAQKQAQPRMVRVPKGWSEYQAAWIVDDDAAEAEVAPMEDEYDLEMRNLQAQAVDNDEDEDEDMGAASEPGVSWDRVRTVRFQDETDAGDDDRKALARGLMKDNEEYDEIMVGGPATSADYDADMDMDQEQRDLEQWRGAANEDLEFPDEVDTPKDMAASLRFSKYRGLQSFRHSKWNPKEELPADYARIYKFKDFGQTRRRVLKDLAYMEHDAEMAEYFVPEGHYVTVVVKDVPAEFMEHQSASGLPLVLWNLIEHENKMTVVNFVLKVQSDLAVPLKSKERLLFDVGMRQYFANPVFSEHSRHDKHKFERYAQPSTTLVASVIAPVTYPPMPLMLYRQKPSGALELVATGSAGSVNPDRLVIKRVRLSGHPYKINKRSATIRYMFFNPDDIDWFKPVEIATKYGRRGHIKESLGTHGHMKCVFDKPMKASDTVLMNLYKRVYPKWTHAEAALLQGQIAQGPQPEATETEGSMEL